MANHNLFIKLSKMIRLKVTERLKNNDDLVSVMMGDNSYTIFYKSLFFFNID
jgi:hypothetical protein